MASAETVPVQEIADLQAQPEPVSPTEGKNRLQKRFDKLTRSVHEWRERYNEAIAHANRLAADNERLIERLADLKTDNKQLADDLAWALGRIQRLKGRIEKLEQTRPITPDPDRYLTKENKQS